MIANLYALTNQYLYQFNNIRQVISRGTKYIVSCALLDSGNC